MIEENGLEQKFRLYFLLKKRLYFLEIKICCLRDNKSLKSFKQ